MAWQLWRCERGEFSPAAYLLLVVIVGLGLVVGLSSVREAFVQEFGDLAVGLEKLDQSYSFSVGTKTSAYDDPPTPLEDPAGAEPAGISVSEAAKDEGS